MIMTKSALRASIFAILMLNSTQLYAKNIFKNSEFLKWNEENRSFYIRTSIGMAGLIAAQNDKAHANCLEKWYFSNQSKKNAFIYGIMKQYPDHHPRGIIMAVLQKQCGSFRYSNK
jgi:hypothetical protein